MSGHISCSVLIASVFYASAAAHMHLFSPATFNSSNNPHRTTPPDPYLDYPFDCCGPGADWILPCRNYTHLLPSAAGEAVDTPDGQPTATWPAGSNQSFVLAANLGGGNHYGGSCQVGFSEDGGRTFRVATSFEGNCPHRNAGDGPDGQEFEFMVPTDLQVGVRLFAWVWYNREQEVNVNCAAVNITRARTRRHNRKSLNRHEGDGASERAIVRSTLASTFDDRPLMLLAADTQAGDGSCKTPRSSAELRFPNPGPDLVLGDGVYPLELPSGDCNEADGKGWV